MNFGKVFLVGAGPGDPGLLTVRAHRLISEADCILYDHLVCEQILTCARPGAELIYVGKQRGKCAMRQETINALLVTKASEHARVVRLKGGDPFIFGRGGEEALALVSAGIQWEVVPGVSAGAAVAAYAGIPVTHRGIASSVAFVTGHEDPHKSDSGINWSHLACGTDTLVFFMGVAGLQRIADKLLEHGRPAETPVAIIQQGTYEAQKVLISSLSEIAALAAHHAIQPPSLIVIGEVVRLREQLQWFTADTMLSATSGCNEPLLYNKSQVFS